MTSIPHKILKPYSPPARQKWFTYFCQSCDIYFKVDCHERDRSKLKNICCPLCKGSVVRKGAME